MHGRFWKRYDVRLAYPLGAGNVACRRTTSLRTCPLIRPAHALRSSAYRARRSRAGRRAAARAARELAVADSSPFRPLELPAPNEMRTGSGRPGRELLAAARRLPHHAPRSTRRATSCAGARRSTTSTTRPTRCRISGCYVEQNICEPSSITNTLNQPPLVFAGIALRLLLRRLQRRADARVAPRSPARDAKRTRSTARRCASICDSRSRRARRSTSTLAWHFNVPEQGAGRMGHDGPLYEIAQWYPRMAVYDDVQRLEPRAVHRRGRVLPRVRRLRRHAHGAARATSSPRPASCGIPEQVLTAAQRARLAARAALRHGRRDHHRATKRASRDARTRPGDDRHAAPGTSPPTTCATSPWPPAPRLALGREQLRRHPDRDALPPDGRQVAREAHRMARGAIKYFSEQWYRYPYSHATTVEGPVGGMEYPMLTFVPNSSDARGPAVGARARVRTRVVPDGRRLERAALSVDGRRLQHLHRPRATPRTTSPARRTATRSRCNPLHLSPSTPSRARSSR